VICNFSACELSDEMVPVPCAWGMHAAAPADTVKAKTRGLGVTKGPTSELRSIEPFGTSPMLEPPPPPQAANAAPQSKSAPVR
jgi:hypothetical protein